MTLIWKRRATCLLLTALQQAAIPPQIRRPQHLLPPHRPASENSFICLR